MTIHRRLEERLADVRAAARPRCCSAPATSRTSGSSRAGARGRGRLLRRAQPRLDRRRLPARARRDLRLRPRRRRAPRVGAAQQADGPRRADRHRRRVLDGRRRRAAAPRSSSSPSAYDVRVVVDEAHGTGALGPGRPRGASPRPGSRTRSTSSSARSARRSAPTARTRAATRRWRSYLVNTARPLIFSTAPPPPAVAGALAALDAARGASRGASSSCRPTPATLRDELAARGLRRRAVDARRSSRSSSARPPQAMRVCELALEQRRVRPGDPPADRAGRAPRGCGSR